MPKKPETPQARYEAANIRRINLKLNRATMPDVLAHLEAQPNMQGYLIGLIKADMDAKVADRPTYGLQITSFPSGDEIKHLKGLPSLEACLDAMPGHGGTCCCNVYDKRNLVGLGYDDVQKTYLINHGWGFLPATRSEALKRLVEIL